jgi:gliding motility-associated-like protein
LFTTLWLPGFSQKSRIPDNTVDFLIPDTVCVNVPFTITNISTSGSTYYWSFCSGNAGSLPSGLPLISVPSMYNQPVFSALVEDNGDVYSFVTNRGDKTVTRNEHHHNLIVPPTSVTLGIGTSLKTNFRGIQVKKDKDNWFGFVTDRSTILRLNFGTTLQNNPTILPFTGLIDTLDMISGLSVLNDGTNWIGFCTTTVNNNIIRIVWGNSLTNVPIATNLGNKGILDFPTQCAVIKKDLDWYILITNEGSNTLTRLAFGNSLLNDPIGTNLGNVGSLDQDEGILLIRDCQELNGFVLNSTTTGDVLVRLNLPGDISGPITGQSIGNIGSLDQPSTFSEVMRLGDTLYTLVTNPGNSTVSLLYFPSCTNASIPSSNVKDPPAISYLTPGQYNIMLVVDEGLPTQENVCKPIIVVPSFKINLGGNRTICTGETITLHASITGGTYVWQDGTTDSILTTSLPGIYWVHVSSNHCTNGDTIEIIACPSEVWFPTAFTPNNDGVNDSFRPVGTSIASFHMSIYDRWGQLMFETDSMEIGWDGTTKGLLCPSGPYSYVVNYKGLDDPTTTRKKQGTFILMR